MSMLHVHARDAGHIIPMTMDTDGDDGDGGDGWRRWRRMEMDGDG